jgi:hypothetical protein
MYLHEEPRVYKVLKDRVEDIVMLQFEKQSGKVGKARLSVRRLREALEELSRRNPEFKKSDAEGFIAEVESSDLFDVEEDLGAEDMPFDKPFDLSEEAWALVASYVKVVMRQIKWDDGVAENETAALDADHIAPSGDQVATEICCTMNLPMPKDKVIVDPLKLGNFNMDCKAFPTLLPDGVRELRSWEQNGLCQVTVHDYFEKRMNSTRQQFQQPDYLFWALHVQEQDFLSRQIGVNIKMTGKKKMFWDDVIGGLTARDKALFKKMCPILRNIRGTTAFWHRERQNLFAMLRELGVPSWFFTITANEAGWPDLLCELLALEVRARDFLLTEQELTTVVQVLYNYIRDKPELKKRLLMHHPVAVARNFEKRVEHLLDFLQRRTDIVGEIKDYYVRFEFQERGSAHAHALFWVAGCPSLHAAQEEASKLGLDLSDEDSEDDDSDKGAENNEEMDKEEENPADIVAEDYVEQPGQPADEVPLAADVQEDAGSTDEDCERCPADGAEREADSSSETDSEALPEQAPEETTAQEDFRWYTEQLQRAERKKPGVLKDMLTYIDAHVTCFRPTARYVKKVQRKLSRARSSGDAEAKALLVRLRRLQKRRTLTNLQSHVCVPGYCYHRQSKKPKCRFGYPQKCRAKTGFTGGRRMYSLRRLINERTTNGYSWPI